MVSTLTIATDRHSQVPVSRTKDQPSPSRIPLTIHLGDRLTDAAEVACAEAVASWLSGECGRAVALAELDGLLLDLWSEDDVDGRALADYVGGESSAPRVRPLQGLLLQSRGLSGDSFAPRVRIAKADLLPYVGSRLEFRVSGLSC